MQGSDFHQRMMLREREECLCLEKQAQEIAQLRGRVRQLEQLVCLMAKKMGIDACQCWEHWRFDDIQS